MQRKNLLCMLAALPALSAFGSPALANEPIVPFITAEYYMDNISMDQFRSDRRELFRNEAAFDLLVDYVAGEIGRPLSASQFWALMSDPTQTRVRDCPTNETIRTGALQGDQFYWFTRSCRRGEQIVQVRVNDRWIDLFSLNCLNAVEDKTPVPPPILQNRVTTVTRYVETRPTPQRTTYVTQNPGIHISGSIMTLGCECCGTTILGTPSIFVEGSISVTTDFGSFGY